MTKRDVHGENDPKVNHEHLSCPDLYCCDCECHTCKRAWFAAGRPKSKDCPDHGTPDLRGHVRRTFGDVTMTSSHAPRNRMRALRMRDGHRWVKVYRQRAWDAAVEEARTRSFLSHLLFAVTHMSRILATTRE